MISLVLLLIAGNAAPPRPTPEARALAYLAREVPRWAKEHRCYSCHHNGDAARALYTAHRLGRSVEATVLRDTTRWLSRPVKWDHNGPDGPFSDKHLARLQFANALVDASDAKLIKETGALGQAARLIAGQQAKDGSWQVVPARTLGSATTYGNTLATHLARRILHRADARHHEAAIARADAWLRKAPVETVLDAAAILLALARSSDPAARKQALRAFESIRKGEAKRGGWGPETTSPPEVFDTALVLLALVEQEQTAEVRAWIERGRTYLLLSQEADGNWPETTRPSGADSYAQRLSTSGWATLALLATRSTSSR